MSETKIYGIPNILLGFDYVTIERGEKIIIYDDNQEWITNEVIKICHPKVIPGWWNCAKSRWCLQVRF